MDQFRIEVDDKVARLTLTRPEKHNAFDDRLIAGLTEAFRRLDADPAVRIVVLAAQGPSFSAGGDLEWMKRAAAGSRDDNVADALKLAGLMKTLDELSKPTIAVVQGSAYGGGVGLIACCDITIAATGAKFARFRGEARADSLGNWPLCDRSNRGPSGAALFSNRGGLRCTDGRGDRSRT